MTKLTEKELAVLNAIPSDDFMDGCVGDEMIGKEIWADTGCDHIISVTGLPRASLGGVMASLSTKGLLKIAGSGRDQTYWLTQEGVNVIVGGEFPIAD